MSAMSLSELATGIADEIEEVHRIQNAERIEAFCRDLASSYRQVLSRLDALLSKYEVLDALAPGEAEGLPVVVQQGRVLVQETTEQALIERRRSLSTAVSHYLDLLAAYMRRVDSRLEAQRADLRARLNVLDKLCAPLSDLYVRETPFNEEIAGLARTLSDLSLRSFAAEPWKRAAERVQQLIGAVTAELEGRLSHEAVAALTTLAMGQAVPLPSLDLQNLKELLDIPAVAERLVIKMESGQEG
jgi:hypothetical protein